MRSLSSKIIFLGALLGLPVAVNAEKNQVSQVIEGGQVRIGFDLQNDFAGTEARVTLVDVGTIEIKIPGALVSSSDRKEVSTFKSGPVANLSLTALKDQSGLMRLKFRAKTAAQYGDLIQMSRSGKHITLEFPEVGDTVLAQNKDAGLVPQKTKTIAIASYDEVATSKTSSVTETNAESTASEKTENEPVLAAKPAPESQIPVMAKTANAAKAENMGIERLSLTFAILCLVLLAAIYGIKRWAKASGRIKSGPQILVLNQHHLGPKKTLAIIQVAGEAMLIGVTDHNINMIKTLALIDDEVPGHVHRDFADELDDMDGEVNSMRADNFAMKGVAEIQDVVSHRTLAQSKVFKAVKGLKKTFAREANI